MPTILVVDDEKNYRLVLRTLLEGEDYEVLDAARAEEALALVERVDLDLVVTDMRMPGLEGMKVLELLKQRRPPVPVIMMTAYGTVEKAVEAMKLGAYDYIPKPFENERLLSCVSKALEMGRLLRASDVTHRSFQSRFEELIGESQAMCAVYDAVDHVASTKTTVLVTGESGTGKELVARAIHHRSPRGDGPFLSVNCGALAEGLLESELFGHQRGAFTGAMEMKKGRFEMADGGSLFLDEVGETSNAFQVNLLRVLEEQTFERVGGTAPIRVDVRIIAATNQDLKAKVDDGVFREDLFYRLNVFPIHLPPLRERSEDIGLLAGHFLARFRDELGKPIDGFSESSLRVLHAYSWPGNVRELENIVERAVVLCDGSSIETSHLPLSFIDSPTEPSIPSPVDLIPRAGSLETALEHVEESLLRQAMEKAGYVQTKAARALGLSRSTLQYKLKKYNVVAPRRDED
ncbi:MAG: sigma-54-dependent transcriptional regulator [Nitrospinota bacterium]